MYYILINVVLGLSEVIVDGYLSLIVAVEQEASELLATVIGWEGKYNGISCFGHLVFRSWDKSVIELNEGNHTTLCCVWSLAPACYVQKAIVVDIVFILCKLYIDIGWKWGNSWELKPSFSCRGIFPHPTPTQILRYCPSTPLYQIYHQLHMYTKSLLKSP